MGGKLVVGVTVPQVGGGMGCEGAYVVVGYTIAMARTPEESGGSDSEACCGT